MRPLSKNQNGVALMIVLWVLVLLIALATEFALNMRTEVRATSNMKEDLESYFLAKAGINLAMAELYKTAKFHAQSPEFGFIVGNAPPPGQQAAPGVQPQQPEEIPLFDIVQRKDIPLGNGFITYSIEDENRKININSAPRDLLIKVLAASGVPVGELQDTIADSILDWIDGDETHHINGAESDYYMTLNPPYRAKNGMLDSLDELIRVRGVTQDILYGSPPGEVNELGLPRYRGLLNYFTTANISYINPNTAPPEILAIVYNEQQIQEIMTNRAQNQGYVNIVSSHFKITATGRMANSNTSHTIIAQMEKLGNDITASLVIRRWKDNVYKS